MDDLVREIEELKQGALLIAGEIKRGKGNNND
jgi:hypothetical protein